MSDYESKGKTVGPEEFHSLVKEGGNVVVDCRNFYESEVCKLHSPSMHAVVVCRRKLSSKLVECRLADLILRKDSKSILSKKHGMLWTLS